MRITKHQIFDIKPGSTRVFFDCGASAVVKNISINQDWKEFRLVLIPDTNSGNNLGGSNNRTYPPLTYKFDGSVWGYKYEEHPLHIVDIV